MNREDLLFVAGDLYTRLEATKRAALKAIDDWEPEQLLATAEADVIDYLTGKYSVACPVLDRAGIQQLPVSEETRSVPGMFSREPYEQRMTKIVLAIPFDGDADVFGFHASRLSSRPPRAQVRPGELRLTWIGDAAASQDSAAVKRYFDEEIRIIDEHLAWARSDIDRFNASLHSLVSAAVVKRRAKLLADRKLAADIGFPIRQRPDASQFSVPVARRKVEPRRPTASGPFQPEPVLPETQYEQALAVLRNARNALERTPSMTSHLDEEKIRDLLLVLLNAQFEGAAAGEVFNAAGKTDILIRAEDRNVFIAECKIWKGPKTIRDALGQLLSYLTWRDTKAALLLFVRTGEPTTIITKSIAEIEGHANYKRTRDAAEDGERYDFVLHANGDPNREIRLAFLPFALQDTQDQQ